MDSHKLHLMFPTTYVEEVYLDYLTVKNPKLAIEELSKCTLSLEEVNKDSKQIIEQKI
jgi:hypothetical protein